MASMGFPHPLFKSYKKKSAKYLDTIKQSMKMQKLQSTIVAFPYI